MPVAGKSYTKKLQLPGYPAEEQAFVVVITNPKAGVIEGLDGIESKEKRAYAMLARIIIEWNFTNEAGEVLQITPEAVETSFSLMDIDYIEEALKLNPQSLTDAKKNS